MCKGINSGENHVSRSCLPNGTGVFYSLADKYLLGLKTNSKKKSYCNYISLPLHHNPMNHARNGELHPKAAFSYELILFALQLSLLGSKK